jgi:DNA-binding GntR family transcriptional regulator
MELQRLKRQRATDEVYSALRHGILGHLFQPGERLLIEDIASKLGVSLTPVRHAIQQLAGEGLVEIRPRSGTYVASLSAEDLKETSEIRCALECLAAELAVERVTDDQLARFREILEALAGPVETDEDRRRHEDDNTRFHALLIEVSGNRRLAEMYESLRAHLQIARAHRRETGWAERLRQEQREHEEIFAALEARDAESLKQALRKHIFRAKDDLVAGVAGQGE